MPRKLQDPDGNDILQWIERVVDPDGDLLDVDVFLNGVNTGNGVVEDGRSLEEIDGFFYNTNQQTLSDGSSAVVVSVNAEASVLESGATYIFEAVAKDPSVSAFRSFKLFINPEIVVETVEVKDIKAESATVVGDLVDKANFDTVQTSFEFRKKGTDSFEKVVVNEEGLEKTFETKLEDLEKAVVYEVRARAEREDAVATGEIIEFTTEAPAETDTDDITDIKQDSACFEGTVVSLADAESGQASFRYRETILQTATLEAPGAGKHQLLGEDNTGIFFRPDGREYFISDQSSGSIAKYEVSVPFDVTTSSESPVQSTPVIDQDNSVTSLFFRKNGTRLYILGSQTGFIYQYDLSEPWNLNTKTLNGKLDIKPQDASPTGMFIKPDGSRLYYTGLESEDIFEYEIESKWDITTAKISRSFSFSNQGQAPRDITLSQEGFALFVVDDETEEIFQYELEVPWNINSVNLVDTIPKFNLKEVDKSPSDIFFRPDDSNMYVTGRENNQVFQFVTDTSFEETEKKVSVTENGTEYKICEEDLKPNTAYFVESKLVTSSGETVFGNRDFFQTDRPIVLELLPTTGINSSGGTLNGIITDLGEAKSADLFFEYRELGKTGEDSFKKTQVREVEVSSITNAVLDGLEEGVTQEFRLVAEASDGDTSKTDINTFTPEESGAVRTVTSYRRRQRSTRNSIDFAGRLINLGGKDEAEVYFEYRKAFSGNSFKETTKRTRSESARNTSGSNAGRFSEVVEGLEEGQRYEFRAVADRGDLGISKGSLAIARTSAVSVETRAPTGVRGQFAVLNGLIKSLGRDTYNVSFEFREKGSGSFLTSDENNANDSTEFKEEIGGLDPETTYEYRALITTSGDQEVASDRGEIREFTTQSPASVKTVSASPKSSLQIDLEGELESLGEAPSSDVSFQVSTGGSFRDIGLIDQRRLEFTEPGKYSYTIKREDDLDFRIDPGTAYTFRAIARTNEPVSGTGYDGDVVLGDPVSVITPPNIDVKSVKTVDTTARSATLRGKVNDFGTSSEGNIFFQYTKITEDKSLDSLEDGDFDQQTEVRFLPFPIQFSLRTETDLEVQERYAWRAVATNSNGDRAVGKTKEFRTNVINLKEPTDFSTDAFTANAKVVSLKELNTVQTFFEFGEVVSGDKEIDFTRTTPELIGLEREFSKRIDGLEPEKNYAVRAGAILPESAKKDEVLTRTFGDDTEGEIDFPDFETPGDEGSNLGPETEFEVSTSTVLKTTARSAILEGEVNDIGNAEFARVYFEIQELSGPEGNPVESKFNSDPDIVAVGDSKVINNPPKKFEITVTGLDPETAYEFTAAGRASDLDEDIAQNSGTFETDEAPSVSTVDPVPRNTGRDVTFGGDVSTIGTTSPKADGFIEYRKSAATPLVGSKLDLLSEENDIQAFDFNGNKLYVIGNENEKVIEFTVPSGGNSGINYIDLESSVDAFFYEASSIQLQNEGKTAFVEGSGGGTYQYKFQPGGSGNPGTFTKVKNNVTSPLVDAEEVSIKNDGETLFVKGSGGVFEYSFEQKVTLDVANNQIEFATQTDSLDVSDDLVSPTGIEVDFDSQERLYITTAEGKLYQYEIPNDSSNKLQNFELDYVRDFTEQNNLKEEEQATVISEPRLEDVIVRDDISTPIVLGSRGAGNRRARLYAFDSEDFKRANLENSFTLKRDNNPVGIALKERDVDHVDPKIHIYGSETNKVYRYKYFGGGSLYDLRFIDTYSSPDFTENVTSFYAKGGDFYVSDSGEGTINQFKHISEQYKDRNSTSTGNRGNKIFKTSFVPDDNRDFIHESPKEVTSIGIFERRVEKEKIEANTQIEHRSVLRNEEGERSTGDLKSFFTDERLEASIVKPIPVDEKSSNFLTFTIDVTQFGGNKTKSPLSATVEFQYRKLVRPGETDEEGNPIPIPEFKTGPIKTIDSPQKVKGKVEGLEPNTEYEYRILVSASDGDEYFFPFLGDEERKQVRNTPVDEQRYEIVSTEPLVDGKPLPPENDIQKDPVTLRGKVTNFGGEVSGADGFFAFRPSGTSEDFTITSKSDRATPQNPNFNVEIDSSGLEPLTEFEYGVLIKADDGDEQLLTDTLETFFVTGDAVVLKDQILEKAAENEFVATGELVNIGSLSEINVFFETESGETTEPQTITEPKTFEGTFSDLSPSAEKEVKVVAKDSENTVVLDESGTKTHVSDDRPQLEFLKADQTTVELTDGRTSKGKIVGQITNFGGTDSADITFEIKEKGSISPPTPSNPQTITISEVKNKLDPPKKVRQLFSGLDIATDYRARLLYEGADGDLQSSLFKDFRYKILFFSSNSLTGTKKTFPEQGIKVNKVDDVNVRLEQIDTIDSINAFVEYREKGKSSYRTSGVEKEFTSPGQKSFPMTKLFPNTEYEVVARGVLPNGDEVRTDVTTVKTDKVIFLSGKTSTGPTQTFNEIGPASVKSANLVVDTLGDFPSIEAQFEYRRVDPQNDLDFESTSSKTTENAPENLEFEINDFGSNTTLAPDTEYEVKGTGALPNNELVQKGGRVETETTTVRTKKALYLSENAPTGSEPTIPESGDPIGTVSVETIKLRVERLGEINNGDFFVQFREKTSEEETTPDWKDANTKITAGQPPQTVEVSIGNRLDPDTEYEFRGKGELSSGVEATTEISSFKTDKVLFLTGNAPDNPLETIPEGSIGPVGVNPINATVDQLGKISSGEFSIQFRKTTEEDETTPDWNESRVVSISNAPTTLPFEVKELVPDTEFEFRAKGSLSTGFTTVTEKSTFTTEEILFLSGNASSSERSTIPSGENTDSIGPSSVNPVNVTVTELGTASNLDVKLQYRESTPEEEPDNPYKETDAQTITRGSDLSFGIDGLTPDEKYDFRAKGILRGNVEFFSEKSSFNTDNVLVDVRTVSDIFSQIPYESNRRGNGRDGSNVQETFVNEIRFGVQDIGKLEPPEFSVKYRKNPSGAPPKDFQDGDQIIKGSDSEPSVISISDDEYPYIINFKVEGLERDTRYEFKAVGETPNGIKFESPVTRGVAKTDPKLKSILENVNVLGPSSVGVLSTLENLGNAAAADQFIDFKLVGESEYSAKDISGSNGILFRGHLKPDSKHKIRSRTEARDGRSAVSEPVEITTEKFPIETLDVALNVRDSDAKLLGNVIENTINESNFFGISDNITGIIEFRVKGSEKILGRQKATDSGAGFGFFSEEEENKIINSLEGDKQSVTDRLFGESGRVYSVQLEEDSLEPDTVHEFRFIAKIPPANTGRYEGPRKEKGSEVIGDWKEFKTQKEPKVTTKEPLFVRTDGAILQGVPDTLGGADSITKGFFQFRKTGSSEWNTTENKTEANLNETFQVRIEDLDPDTEYEYRAKTLTSDGDDGTSNDIKTFKTDKIVKVETLEVVDSGADFIEVKGKLNQIGAADSVDLLFEYRRTGLNQDLGLPWKQVLVKEDISTQPREYTFRIENLTVNAIFEVRARAEANGLPYAGFGTFDTGEAITDSTQSGVSVITGDQQNIGGNSATFVGQAVSIGEESDTAQAFFEFREVGEENLRQTIPETISSVPVQYTETVTTLSSNTEHEYRPKIVNENGKEAVGVFNVFKTLELGSLKTLEVPDAINGNRTRNATDVTVLGELEELKGREGEIDIKFRFKEKEENEFTKTGLVVKLGVETDENGNVIATVLKDNQTVSNLPDVGEEVNIPFEVRTNISSLVPDTDHEVEVIGETASGDVISGGVVEFRTADEFGILTRKPQDIGDRSAILVGSAINVKDPSGGDQGGKADVSFEFREKGESEFTNTQGSPRFVEESGEFTSGVGGLPSNTTFEYKAVGENPLDTVKSGEIRTFTTEPAPKIETLGVTNVEATTATFSGELKDLAGAKNVDVFFEFKPKNAQNFQESERAVKINQGKYFIDVGDNSPDSSLTQNTVFEVRAKAVASDGGISTGNIVEFQTDKALQIQTSPINRTDVNFAEFRGKIDSLGGAGNAEIFFEYRKAIIDTDNFPQQTEPTVVTQQELEDSPENEVTQIIGGLEKKTEFEYRIRAVASDGDRKVGSTKSFSTDGLFLVATGFNQNISGNSATFSGNIVDLGGASEAEARFKYRPQFVTDQPYDLEYSGLLRETPSKEFFAFSNSGEKAYDLKTELVDKENGDGKKEQVIVDQLIPQDLADDPNSFVLQQEYSAEDRLVVDEINIQGDESAVELDEYLTFSDNGVVLSGSYSVDRTKISGALSTISETSSSQVPPSAEEITFSGDGTKMYTVFGSSISQYTLPSPYETSGASLDTSFNSSLESSLRGIQFRPDGTEMFVVGSNTDTVYRYNLTTPYEVGTAQFTGDSHGVRSEDNTPTDVTFNSDGTKMFVSGKENNRIREYSLQTPYRLDQVILSDTFSVASETSSVEAVEFTSDGRTMIVSDQQNAFEYVVSTPFNILDATYSGESVSVGSNRRGMEVIDNSDTEKIFFVSRNGSIKKFDISFSQGESTQFVAELNNPFALEDPVQNLQTVSKFGRRSFDKMQFNQAGDRMFILRNDGVVEVHETENFEIKNNLLTTVNFGFPLGIEDFAFAAIPASNNKIYITPKTRTEPVIFQLTIPQGDGLQNATVDDEFRKGSNILKHGQVVDNGNKMFINGNQIYTLNWNTTDSVKRTSTGPFTKDVDGLEDDTSYDYLTAGTATDGDINEGSERQFSTPEIPTIETLQATNVENRSAVLNGNLADLGTSGEVEVGFEIGELGDELTEVGESFEFVNSPGQFSFELTDLDQNTDFEFRAKVKYQFNSTAVADTRTFYTPIQKFEVETRSSSDVSGKQPETSESVVGFVGSLGETDDPKTEVDSANAQFLFTPSDGSSDPYRFDVGGFQRRIETNAKAFNAVSEDGEKAFRYKTRTGPDPDNDGDEDLVLEISQYQLPQPYFIDKAPEDREEFARVDFAADSGSFKNLNFLDFKENGTRLIGSYEKNGSNTDGFEHFQFTIKLDNSFDLSTVKSTNTFQVFDFPIHKATFDDDGTQLFVLPKNNRVDGIELHNTGSFSFAQNIDTKLRFGFPDGIKEFTYEAKATGDLFVFTPFGEKQENRVYVASADSQEIIEETKLERGLKKDSQIIDDGNKLFANEYDIFNLNSRSTPLRKVETPFSEVSEVLNDLQEGTTYNYEFEAINTENLIAFGGEKQFTTEDAPTLETFRAENVTPRTARLRGRILNRNNSNNPEIGFEIREAGTSEFTQVGLESNRSNGTYGVSVGQELSTQIIDQNRFYEYRAIAVQGDGTKTTGDLKSFYTPIKPLNVVTETSSKQSSTSFKLGGTIDSLGPSVDGRREIADQARGKIQYRSSSKVRNNDVEVMGVLFESNETFDSISEDGEKAYRISSDGNNDVTIGQYNLREPFLLDSANFEKDNTISSAGDISGNFIRFVDEGNVLLLSTEFTNVRIELANPYDIGTFVDVNETSNARQSGENYIIDFNGDGTEMYVLNNPGDELKVYTTSGFNIQGATFDKKLSFGLPEGILGFTYNSISGFNDKFYLTPEGEGQENRIYQYEVTGSGIESFSKEKESERVQIKQSAEVVDVGRKMFIQPDRVYTLEWNVTDSEAFSSSRSSYNKTVEDLDPNVTHEFRALARNSDNGQSEGVSSVASGQIKTFTTEALIEVETREPTNVTPRSVKLRGNIDALPSGSSVSVGFEARKSGSGNSFQDVDVISRNSTGNYSFEFKTEQNQFFEYRAKAEASDGTVITGNIRTFYTPFKPLTVQTGSAQETSPLTVEFTGTLNSLGPNFNQGPREEAESAELRIGFREQSISEFDYDVEVLGRYAKGADSFDAMSPDGKKAYTLSSFRRFGDESVIEIEEFNLRTPFDIDTSTGSVNILTLDIENDNDGFFSDQEGDHVPRYMNFDQNENILYGQYKEVSPISDFASETFERYFTVELDSNNSLSSNPVTTNFKRRDDLTFNGDGTVAYVSGSRFNFQTVEIYDLSTPYNMGSRSFRKNERLPFSARSIEYAARQNSSDRLFAIRNGIIRQFEVTSDDEFVFEKQRTVSTADDQIQFVDGGSKIFFGDVGLVSRLDFNTTTEKVLNDYINDYTGVGENLEDNTVYEYKAIGNNSNVVERDFDSGQIKTFETSGTPTVTTQEVSNVSPRSFTMNGTIEDLGGEPEASVGFELKKVSDNLPDKNINGFDFRDENVITRSSTGSYQFEITDIEQNAFYLVRAKAVSSSGTVVTGDIVSVQTPVKEMTLVTNETTEIQENQAKFNGFVDSLGPAPGPREEADSADVVWKHRPQGNVIPYSFRTAGVAEKNRRLLNKDNFEEGENIGTVYLGGVSEDGSKAYVVKSVNDSKIYIDQYPLSENYRLGTIEYSRNGRVDVFGTQSSANISSERMIRFYESGTVASFNIRYYNGSENVHPTVKLDLGTAYDLSTVQSKTVTSTGGNSFHSLFFNSDGSRALIDEFNRVEIYETPSSYVFDRDQDKLVRSTNFGLPNFEEGTVYKNGHLYVRNGESYYQYSISPDFDFSNPNTSYKNESLGVTLEGKFEISSGDVDISRTKIIAGSGTEMYDIEGRNWTLEWNTTNPVFEGNVLQDVSRVKENLRDGTVHEFKISGQNTQGVVDEGNAKTFETTDTLTIETRSFSSVTFDSATISGEVFDFGSSSSADIGFQFRKKGESEWQETSFTEATSPKTYSEEISVEFDNVYEYRAKAVDPNGNEFFGDVFYFIVPIQPFTVETTESTNVSPQNAKLIGEVVSEGRRSKFDPGSTRQTQSDDVEAVFEYNVQGESPDPDFETGSYVRRADLGLLGSDNEFFNGSGLLVGMNPDGSKAYFANKSNQQSDFVIEQYILNDNFVIGSLSSKEGEYKVANNPTNEVTSVKFYQSGSVAALFTNENAIKINLNTPYDFTDVSSTEKNSYASSTVHEVVYSESGNEALVTLSGLDEIVHYDSLNKPYLLNPESDLVNISYRDFFGNQHRGFKYQKRSGEDDKLFIFDNEDRHIVKQYSISDRFDLSDSSRSLDGSFLSGSKRYARTAIGRNSNDKKLFADGGERIYSFSGKLWRLDKNITQLRAFDEPRVYTGLAENVSGQNVYEYRAIASTPDGDVETGSKKTFEIQDELEFGTDPASNVGRTEATLNGTVESLGTNSSVNAKFEYNTPVSQIKYANSVSDDIASDKIEDLYFKPDGTKLFVVSGGAVRQRNLDTTWNVDSFTGSSKSFDPSSNGGPSDLRSFHAKPDGTQFFIASNDKIIKAGFGGSWDVSNAVVGSESIDLSSDIAGGIENHFFREDGKKLYVSSDRRVFQYGLSTAWDVTTASIEGQIELSGTDHRDFEITSSGKKMYVIRQFREKITEYELKINWDVSTAEVDSEHFFNSDESTIDNGNNDPVGIALQKGGDRIFITEDINDRIYTFEGLESKETSSQLINSAPQAFSKTVSGLRSDAIYEYRIIIE